MAIRFSSFAAFIRIASASACCCFNNSFCEAISLSILFFLIPDAFSAFASSSVILFSVLVICSLIASASFSARACWNVAIMSVTERIDSAIPSINFCAFSFRLSSSISAFLSINS
jgi:hypothetical protein